MKTPYFSFNFYQSQMKPILALLLLTLIPIFSFSQELTEYDEEIMGTWEGTIYSSGLDTKTLKVMFTYSEFNWETENGLVEGYSTVNNGNKTVFTGSYKVDGDMPFLELVEPKNNQTNGIFKLELRCTTDEGVQDYCCGEWMSYNKEIQRKIRLEKSKDNLGTFEIIQSGKIDNIYFKTIISKIDDSFSVTGVKILEKNTDKLLQTFDVECEYKGKNQISIGDYNFDGLNDFSVFEFEASGAQTSNLYFLFDPIKKEYFNSGFSGALEFDADKKIIIEENQIGPEQKMSLIYKVVNNQMVLTEEHCFIWDEGKEDFIEQDIKFCK